MPLFAGWFRQRKQNQDKNSGPAGIEERTASGASGSGGLLRLASLRGRRSDAAEQSSPSQDGVEGLSTQGRKGSGCQVHPESLQEQEPRSYRRKSLASVPADPAAHVTSWSQLPDEALELIFACLSPDSATSEAQAQRQREAMYNVTAVCKAWRRVGLYCFFRNLSAGLPHVTHPLQLFRLSNVSMMGSTGWKRPDSGLMECYVKRVCQETVSLRPGHHQVVTKFMLFCGPNCRDPRKSKYLLSARLSTRTETTIFYDKECRAASARLASNLLGTRYQLDLAPGVHKAFAREQALGNDSFLAGCGAPLPAKGAAEVLYKTRLKGFMKPRRMRLNLPAVGEQAPHAASSPLVLSSPLTSRASVSRCMTDSLTEDADAGDLFAETLQGPNFGPEPEPERRQSAFASLMESIGLHTLNTNLLTTTANLATAASCGLFRDRALREEDTNEDVMATQKLGVGAGSTTLVNKAPHWNEQLRCWCLNFKGRVKLASVKNFQLVCENDLQTIVMQFGKVDGDHYILDFQPSVISAVQAFAVALSTFDTKVLL